MLQSVVKRPMISVAIYRRDRDRQIDRQRKREREKFKSLSAPHTASLSDGRSYLCSIARAHTRERRIMCRPNGKEGRMDVGIWDWEWSRILWWSCEWEREKERRTETTREWDQFSVWTRKKETLNRDPSKEVIQIRMHDLESRAMRIGIILKMPQIEKDKIHAKRECQCEH